MPIDNSEFVRALIKRFHLSIFPNHAYDGSTIRVQIRNSFSSEIAQHLSEQPGHGDASSVYRWRLDIVEADSGTDVVRSLTLPIVSGESQTEIDSASLSEGLYRVRANIVFPDGSAQRIWHEPEPPRTQPYSAERFLAIHRGPIPTMETRIVHSPNPLTRLCLQGNPGRRQFPGDDAMNCHARSVWDLQLYQGRIYVGVGDGYNRQGPIDVWSYDPESDPVIFEKEITVDEEEVHMFRDFDGRLLVPGNNATESWEFGNLYIKEQNAWRKLRTIPNGIHVLGIVIHRGRLFVTTGTELGPALYESEDDGETWCRYGIEEKDGRWDRRFYEIGALGDDLVLTVGHEYVYRFRNEELTRIIMPVLPGLMSDRTLPFRVTAFSGGLLYAASEWLQSPIPGPLYFVRDLEQGAMVVKGFEDRSVRDILARDGTCYVLTSTRQDTDYFSEVYSTQDLVTWSRIAQFRSDAIAYSLERSGELYFIGMATLRDAAIQDSGSIYLLDR